MHVAGIIAEYNPLHNGHVYQIEKARELCRADRVVVCMSGPFVQRGETAVASKYERAEWAVRSGADIVIEMPVTGVLAPAECFAETGVRLLQATGVVTHLSFGCETGDTEKLYRFADIRAAESGTFRSALERFLGQGMSYPRAYAAALGASGIGSDDIAAMQLPNTVLAMEYIAACRKFAPSFEIVPVLRNGADHLETELRDGFSSASAIRGAIRSGDGTYVSSVPKQVAEGLAASCTEPGADEKMLSCLAMAALRSATAEGLRALPDVSEGFENVLLREAAKHHRLADFYPAVKTKRFTLSRIRRNVMQNLLGITAEKRVALSQSPFPYLRILAAKKEALPLCGTIRDAAPCPVLMRHADETLCPDGAARLLLETDRTAHALHELVLDREIRKDHMGTVIVP
ncbi:MAG: nucleotidyltransferase family protein [Clostridia bacterium]|nr:nucleotidyltransferase family protein [Clostridia bacterium]